MDHSHPPTGEHRAHAGAARPAPNPAGAEVAHRPVRHRSGLIHLAVALLVFAAVGAAGLFTATPASAAPTAPFGFGFVWADQSTAASYLPNSIYQYNSAHSGQAVNTVTRQGVGSYTVFLPNLGSASGTVLVTAYGGTSVSCKVAGWGPSGTTQTIAVRCFDANGQAADSRYTVSYTNAVNGGNIGYAWADQPSAASYVPAASYQGNSTGGTNRITRFGVGGYQVFLPNLGGAGGHVQVTAYGSGSERCKVGGWGPSGTDQVVTVLCFTAAGVAVDTRFTVTFVRDSAIFGTSFVCCQPDGYPVAYAWANEPTSASYVPSTAYQFADFQSRDTTSITRQGTGSYAVRNSFTHFTAGNVQVTAYGFGSEHCNTAFWTDPDGIQVRCFSANGSPVDTLFTVSYAGQPVIG